MCVQCVLCQLQNFSAFNLFLQSVNSLHSPTRTSENLTHEPCDVHLFLYRN